MFEDKRKVEIERFEQTIDIVREQFPDLEIRIVRDHPHVEAVAEMPRQSGLDFDVHINLQNCDEMHLCVSNFWGEWFPCGDERIFEQYMDALTGVLSGEYRIVEKSVFGEHAIARLQRPKAVGSWETAYTSSTLSVLIPWFRTTRIVQKHIASPIKTAA